MGEFTGMGTKADAGTRREEQGQAAEAGGWRAGGDAQVVGASNW